MKNIMNSYSDFSREIDINDIATRLKKAEANKNVNGIILYSYMAHPYYSIVALVALEHIFPTDVNEKKDNSSPIFLNLKNGKKPSWLEVYDFANVQLKHIYEILDEYDMPLLDNSPNFSS